MKFVLLKVLAAAALLAMLLGALIVTKFYFIDEWWQEAGATRGQHCPSNATVVTAFFALGFDPASASASQLALLGHFHSTLALLLRLRLPIVVFTDSVSAQFVADVRQSVGLHAHTRIWNISLSELPLWANFSLFRATLDQQQDVPDPVWYRYRAHIDANRSVEFRILANSKSHFLNNASLDNHFNSSAFIWLDPTYGNGKISFFPTNFEWNPKFPEGKITLFKLTPANDSIHLHDKDEMYLNRDTNLLSTEFMAGDKNAIERFHSLFTEKLMDAANREGIFGEDDQNILVQMIRERPFLFNLIQGVWFNAFHLF